MLCQVPKPQLHTMFHLKHAKAKDWCWRVHHEVQGPGWCNWSHVSLSQSVQWLSPQVCAAMDERWITVSWVHHPLQLCTIEQLNSGDSCTRMKQCCCNACTSCCSLLIWSSSLEVWMKWLHDVFASNVYHDAHGLTWILTPWHQVYKFHSISHEAAHWWVCTSLVATHQYVAVVFGLSLTFCDVLQREGLEIVLLVAGW